MKKIVSHSTSRSIGLLLLFSLLYFFFYKSYLPKMNAFGCFDDCFNYTAGYFIGKGKLLYTEIFFNHQLTMPYMSMLIQKIAQPTAMYELLLRHRQFHYLFAFLMSLLIALRFGWQFTLFSIIYEPTKFYLFGERFLAEGFIVYPFVYLFASLWHRLHKKAFISIDIILIPLFTWFIVFSREPYVPAAVFLFILALWSQKKSVIRCVMGAIVIGMSGAIFTFLSFKDFYFNVVTVNRLTVFQTEMQNTNAMVQIMKSFFYPVVIVCSKLPWNDFHILLSAYTLIGLFLIIFTGKSFKPIIFLITFLLLGLVNLRYVAPDTAFYSAFHLLPWYALFITFLILLLQEFSVKKQYVAFFILLLPVILFSIRPASFLRERTSTSMHGEFLTNYGHLFAVANTVNALSNSDETLFLDGADELIYWQADRMSSYQFSWYTSVMPRILRYVSARSEMFKTDPPDFYYRFCSKNEIPDLSLPDNVRYLYTQLLESGKPSCLYIKKALIPSITSAQWEKAGKFNYSL